MRSTRADGALLLVRIALAVVFVAHGGQKVFGWFGGPGLEQTVDAFKWNLGLPGWLSILASFTELLGGLAVGIGFLTRIAALGLATVMAVGAALSGEMTRGFFMNWTGQKQGEGFEYNLTLLLMSLALVWAGSGRWGIDRLIHDRLAIGSR